MCVCVFGQTGSDKKLVVEARMFDVMNARRQDRCEYLDVGEHVLQSNTMLKSPNSTLLDTTRLVEARRNVSSLFEQIVL